MIIHIDMDAFYASVEIRDSPGLSGKPVVVGGGNGARGVICAASYEARKHGVFSAMPVSMAKRLCSDLIFVKPRMHYYAQVSSQLREIFLQYTPLVEPVSLDEAFLDVTGSKQLLGTAEVIAQDLRHTIQKELRLSCSTGIAPNKFLAKVASGFHKPAGNLLIPPDKVDSFLTQLPVSKIWGIGEKCETKLAKLGIRTVGQLRQLSRDDLRPIFGSSADHFWNLARGIDNRTVIPDRQTKTISHEKTFPRDIEFREHALDWIRELSIQVACRARRVSKKARSIQLKIRYSDFSTITRCKTLPEPTDINADIVQSSIAMAEKVFDAGYAPVRLLGVGLTNLQSREKWQLNLFEQTSQELQKTLDRVTDDINRKHGEHALANGSKFVIKSTCNRSADSTPGPE
ncbi:MAG: DNA polymerase IV [Planctomycetota bacterium]|nr:DNA polymerase IV [Planctomycetota bacterium]